MMRKITKAFLMMGVCILLGIVSASASQLHLIPLEKDAKNIKCLLRVKVTKIERGQTHMELEYGSEGPMSSSHILISGDAQEVVWGTCTLKKIRTKYTWIVPIKYDKKGKDILSFSPICSGSGTENDVKEGEEYLFSYSYAPAITDKEKEPTFYHMRSDPISRKDEILKLLQKTGEQTDLSDKPDAGHGK